MVHFSRDSYVINDVCYQSIQRFTDHDLFLLLLASLRPVMNGFIGFAVSLFTTFNYVYGFTHISTKQYTKLSMNSLQMIKGASSQT